MNTMDRRDFLKVLGISGAAATLAGCGNTAIESGNELVMSYVHPQDYVIPGIGTYFASTCTRCYSGCGIMGNVREGRILKLEGNPESAISRGKICGLGQAAVQDHYNPDRLTTPLMRDNGSLKSVSWETALASLSDRLGAKSPLKGDQVAFLTGETGGHQKVLLENFLSSFDSTNHVAYDPLSRVTGQLANREVLGASQPRYEIDKARLILSFGNDFLGAGISPVAMAAQYAKFRRAPRGTLVQIEPRMTLTGGNADRWIPIKPGTEGLLALGIIHALMQHDEFSQGIPDDVLAILQHYDRNMVGELTGVPPDTVHQLSQLLWGNLPSVILSGPTAEGHAYGFSNASAINLLNVMLSNVGKTVVGQAVAPFEQMTTTTGSYSALAKLHQQMMAGETQALLISGVNPSFTSPVFMPFDQALAKVPYKVALVTHLDETASQCDLVLPLLSGMEDFGTHVPDYQPTGFEMQVQQPLMEKLYPQTRGFGDILLDVLKMRQPGEYNGFPDYYAYLKTAVVKAKPVFKSTQSDDDFWEDALRAGVLKLDLPASNLEPKIKGARFELPNPRLTDIGFPFYFHPSVRQDMRDGRHAHLSWLQESPETLTTIVWDSWIEIHPKTAEEMQILNGDILEIKSSVGTVTAKAYLFPGIQKDTVSMPLGQGHTQFGRYADGVGVNPFKILDPVFDRHTGEFAMHATRVQIRKTGQNELLVKDEGPTGTQQNMELVRTLRADKAKLAEEI